MRTFFVIARLRILDVTRSASSSLLFLAMPIVLLLVVGLVFVNGHPFERRHVVVVGSEPAVEAVLAQFPEVKIDREASEEAGLGKLRSRMANAVLARRGGLFDSSSGRATCYSVAASCPNSRPRCRWRSPRCRTVDTSTSCSRAS